MKAILRFLVMDVWRYNETEIDDDDTEIFHVTDTGKGMNEF